MSTPVTCPKCKSDQLSANKKGFSGKKAVAGAILTGGIGLLAGTMGSNKIIITCLSCGNQFKPGARPIIKPAPPQIGKEGGKAFAIIFGVLFSLLGIIILFTGSWIAGLILLLIGIFFIIGFISASKTPNK